MMLVMTIIAMILMIMTDELSRQFFLSLTNDYEFDLIILPFNYFLAFQILPLENRKVDLGQRAPTRR